jgi:N-acetylmuramoyl-L-alanine amidase
MPSVLSEISFVSHPEDEKRLREAAHRQRIAEGLLAGVRAYLQALDRSGTRLTHLDQATTVDAEVR